MSNKPGLDTPITPFKLRQCPITPFKLRQCSIASILSRQYKYIPSQGWDQMELLEIQLTVDPSKVQLDLIYAKRKKNLSPHVVYLWFCVSWAVLLKNVLEKRMELWRPEWFLSWRAGMLKQAQMNKSPWKQSNMARVTCVHIVLCRPCPLKRSTVLNKGLRHRHVVVM